MFLPAQIVFNSCSYELLYFFIFDAVSSMEISSPVLFRVKSCVNQFVRIWKTCSFKEIVLRMIPEKTQCTHQSVSGPYGGIPFPPPFKRIGSSKKEGAAKASRLFKPASNRNIVLIPHMNEAAKVLPSNKPGYIRYIRSEYKLIYHLCLYTGSPI